MDITLELQVALIIGLQPWREWEEEEIDLLLPLRTKERHLHSALCTLEDAGLVKPVFQEGDAIAHRWKMVQRPS